MKLKWALTVALTVCLAGEGVHARSPETLDELLGQIRQARTEEAEANQERERMFLADKESQERRLEVVKSALEVEERRSVELQQRFETNERRVEELEARVKAHSGKLLELFGVGRDVAGNAKAAFERSLISTQIPGRTQAIANLAESKSLPAIEELENLWFALQEEMTESGKVVNYRTKVIGVDGSLKEDRVTRVGTFNAVSNGRFLLYVPETGQLQELPRQPAAHHQRLAAELDRTTSALLPMTVDPSRGAVLSLLVKVPDLIERIQQGRMVGYVIIGIALIGLLVSVERFWYLTLIGRRIIRQIGSEAPNHRNPLGRILAVYQKNQHLDTETLELKIDQAILSNLPTLQRGLQTLRVLAVIAPLLGLLGTVTGLIETFQSITLFGTGDPRLMAGGISQALVTTVLGLVAAIPLILSHSTLTSKSKRMVCILEEQSAGIIATHVERREGHVVAA